MQCACSELYCHVWPARLYNIIPHYLIKCTVSEKKVIERKMCVVIFSTTLSENIAYSKKNRAIYDQKTIWVFIKIPVIFVTF